MEAQPSPTYRPPASAPARPPPTHPHAHDSYSPKTDLAAGLARFVQWYFEYYGPDGAKLAPDEVHYVPD